MTLDQDDKEFIQLTINNAVSSITKGLPCETHTLTFFGPDGKGGMYGDVEKAKKDIKRLNGKVLWLSAAVTGASATFTYFYNLFKNN